MSKVHYGMRYWHCIIGPTNQDILPEGCDANLRVPVRRAFEELTGKEDEHCWSGWGMTEEEKNFCMSYRLFQQMKSSFLYRLKFLFKPEL